MFGCTHLSPWIWNKGASFYIELNKWSSQSCSWLQLRKGLWAGSTRFPDFSLLRTGELLTDSMCGGVANSESHQNPPGVKLDSWDVSLMGRIFVSYRILWCALWPDNSISARGHCVTQAPEATASPQGNHWGLPSRCFMSKRNLSSGQAA